MTKNKNEQEGPYTAIVVGAGCSVSLGVPTMPAFMDQVYSTLAGSKDTDDKVRLEQIKAFLHRIKPSGAYVRTQMLNIEELYGMVDLALDLATSGKAPGKATQCASWKPGSGGRKNSPEISARCAREALNRAIFSVAKDAGSDFLITPNRFPRGKDELDLVKRESATETIRAWDQGSKYTNLLAYLCLASHEDAGGIRPLFIQFNWDLALDRALNHLGLWKADQEIPPWYLDTKDHSYKEQPRVARPHGGLCWVDTESSERKRRKKYLDGIEDALTKGSCCRFRHMIGGRYWNKDVWIDPAPIICSSPPETDWSEGQMMAIVPPTWRKQSTKPAYQDQWRFISEGLRNVRRIVFIGYSLPRSDLYFRHFLALALAENDYSPKIYVWNPGIKTNPEVRDSYLDLFAPLAREGRVFAIDGYFGNPALFDLERALRTAEPLYAQG